jgi:branched-chain amino acid transport system permease protein
VLQFVNYTLSGLSTSAIYALAATGLVLTYTTTGTFNFAHGATGMLAAFAYWQLRFGWHWPAPVALIVVLLILAPLFGALVELLVMRRLQGTPEATRLVVTISLLVAILGAALWIWNPNAPRPVRSFFSGHNINLAGVHISFHDTTSMVLAILVAIGLRLFLYRSRIGVAMRAAVDDRSLARLTGARPDTGAMLAWAIGASLAALAGILISPTLNVSAVPLTLLIVNAYAAAMIGRLRSLPWTFGGAVILGLTNEYLPDYLKQTGVGGRYLDGMYLAVPAIMLFVVLLILPNPRLAVSNVARGREVVPRPTWMGTVAFGGVVMVGAAMTASVVGRSDLETISTIFGIAIIGLSLVPLIGFAGQVSLCQFSFAGIGAVVMAHMGAGGNPLGLLGAAVVAGAVGALIALPALRLSGIYLALATAAFAVIMDRWIFVFPKFSVFGHQFDLFQEGSLTVPRPRVGSVGFEGQRAEFVLLAGAFTFCALIVVWIRRSNFGSRLLAMKDSPPACATLGLNLTRTKLAVFALSAAMAGFGGALYGGALRVPDAGQFDFFTALPVLLIMVVCGIGVVGGALACGILLGAPVLGNLFPGLPELQVVLAGLAGIGLARTPNGFVIALRARFERLARLPYAASLAAALIVVWLLRVSHIISNWPYVITTAVIVIAAPMVASLVDRSVAAAGGAVSTTPDAVPLEWAGITRPFTHDDLARTESVLALSYVDPRG